MAQTPQLKLALFGQSGAGKTTFFASYYGNQRSREFADARGYRLVARRPTQANALLGRFHAMEEGIFPPGTDAADVYDFDLMVGNLPSPGLHVSWLDYPGGWWERVPKDAAERDERLRALGELVSSHAIILLLDGQRMEAGHGYLRGTLKRFAGQINGIKGDLHRLGQGAGELPRTVLLAVSKADLLDGAVSAETVAKRALVDAESEVSSIACALGTPDDPAPFLSHVVLLSSAHAADGSRADPRRTMGLDLIAPVAIAAVLDDAARKAGRGRWWGELASALEGLADLVGLVDALDDRLPKKYQIVTHLLRILPLERVAKGGADALRQVQEEAARRCDVMTATAATMLLEVAEARGTRACYHAGA